MALVFVFRHIGSAARTITLATFCSVVVPIAAHGQAAATPNPAANGAAPPSVAKPSQSAAHSEKPPVHRHKTKAEALAKVAEAPHPAPPPPPDWPVNDKAEQASVYWNGRNLHIAATNSSLQQILHDVSTATGVKVEGEATDERIYGSYGPAPARVVLGELLEGSGYNVLMVGDKGEGTPRELVLTVRTQAEPKSAAAAAHARQSADDEVQEDPEPVEQPNPGMHRPFGGAPGQPGQPGQPDQGASPEQIMNEMQQRRQQMQQQQGQPVPPQPNPQAQPPND